MVEYARRIHYLNGDTEDVWVCYEDLQILEKSLDVLEIEQVTMMCGNKIRIVGARPTLLLAHMPEGFKFTEVVFGSNYGKIFI